MDIRYIKNKQHPLKEGKSVLTAKDRIEREAAGIFISLCSMRSFAVNLTIQSPDV